MVALMVMVTIVMTFTVTLVVVFTVTLMATLMGAEEGRGVGKEFGIIMYCSSSGSNRSGTFVMARRDAC